MFKLKMRHIFKIELFIGMTFIGRTSQKMKQFENRFKYSSYKDLKQFSAGETN